MRIDTDVQYDCSTFDPIAFVHQHGLKYGFHRAQGVASYTVPGLGDAVDRYLTANPDVEVRNEHALFKADGSWRRNHFINNFEIVSKAWFESVDYQRVFKWLDRNETGFFSERWCVQIRAAV